VSRSVHPGRLDELEDGARLVFVNDASETIDAPSVGVDAYEAGRTATQHLLDLGHERIGYIGGPAYYSATRAQCAGYRDALAEAGVEGGALVYYDEESTFDGGARSVDRILESGPSRPTGVICNNDLMAIGILDGLAARGLSVPGDLSVVGFDGIDLASWTQPKLTTMEQPIEEIASTAIEALRTLIDEPARVLPRYTFRARLRVGGSTAPPA